VNGDPTPDDGEPGGVETLRLADGRTAELISRNGGWILQVDGLRQSHLDPPGGTPSLAITRWMLAALPREPAQVVHLGGGLLSLPRAVAGLAPGVQQLVVELDPTLVALNRKRFGVPEGVTLTTGDARAWLDAQISPPWSPGGADAVVIDVFAGGRIPPTFTSRECYAGARRPLAVGGVLLVNSVAAGDLVFTRRQLATLRSVFAHVAFVVQGSALHGLRFGNALLIGSDAPIDIDGIKARLAGDASRGALVTDLDDLVGDARPVSDDDALWSPVPDVPDLSGAVAMADRAKSLGRTLREVSDSADGQR